MPNSNQSSTDLLAERAIESLKLRVGDSQAHYLKAGSGPPVVLLHGGASDSRDWAETMVALSHSYTFYAPDLIGFGLSDKDEGGYYLSDFVEFTLGFIQALGLNSHILVGHSIGGRVCLEIALRYPEKVHKLVLIDTVGFSKLTHWGYLLGTLAWGVRKFLRHPQPYPKYLKKDSEDKEWMCLEKLPDLKMPTLLVWYKRDPYYPLTGALRAKDLIPEVRLEVLPGYGHAPHLKNRSSFNSLLQSFLDHN